MERGLYNITTVGISTLLPISGNSGSIRSIRLCNYSLSNSVTVDLFLYDSANVLSYYIQNLVIPIKTTLLLDDDVAFDNSVLGMQVKTSGTTPLLSIIIK
tara:strand:+ start:156 stop:455 length:300 start_codon:yes stop_codon:yes gene_type:complete